MLNPAERDRRLSAARKSRDAIASYYKVDDIDHRSLAIHDRIDEAIDAICTAHQKSRGQGLCFTTQQIECLKEIGFHIHYVADPRNQAPHRLLGRIFEEVKGSSWITRLTLIFAVIGAVSSLMQAVDYTIKGIAWARTYNSDGLRITDESPSADRSPKAQTPAPLFTMPKAQ
jgi:hypothetical protein